jgi:hypothetical protein
MNTLSGCLLSCRNTRWKPVKLSVCSNSYWKAPPAGGDGHKAGRQSGSRA